MKTRSRALACTVSALAAVSLLTGCSGLTLLDGLYRQTDGGLGDTLSNMFFDFTVNSATVVDSYDGYTAADGNKLLVCDMTLENTFGEALPMFDSDFQIQWGPGEEDYAYSVDPVETDADGMPTNSQMPLSWEMPDGAVETYDLLFEVPADATNFDLVYLEQYVDSDGNEGQGDIFTVSFALDNAA